MREKLLTLCLALTVLCAGCMPGAAKDGPAEGEAAVWFLAGENGTEGAALTPEFRSLPQEKAEGEALLELLLIGPEESGLSSPFPQGTTLKSLHLDGDLALVDLSEAYGGLSGVDLTLADGCITLTLCQLPGVDRVYLTVEGGPRPFRDQVLSPGDFLLENGAGETENENQPVK